MERRELLTLGGIAAIAGAFARTARAETDAPQTLTSGERQTQVVRIYEDEQGMSHLQELMIATATSGRSRSAQELQATSVLIKEYPPDDVVDWHRASARQFAITITGELEVEVSGGIRRRVRTGDLVFLEDTRGKGHITRFQGRVTNLFIRVPDRFDLVAWSTGKDSPTTR